MINKYIPNSVIIQVCFIIILLLLTSVIVSNLSIFLPGFLGALCLYLLLYNLLRTWHLKWGYNKTLGIILLMLLTGLLIFLPIWVLVSTLGEKIITILNQKDDIQTIISKTVESIHLTFNIDLLDKKYLEDLAQIALKLSRSIINTTVDSLIQLVVAFFILYFMLADYQNLEKWLFNNIPIQKQNIRILNKELRAMVISNAIGMPVVAFLQGIIAWIGYLLFGLDNTFTWFILTAFAGMIPVVGTAVVYIPAIIVLISQGHTQNALFLLIYCLVIVGGVDNLLRFLIQKKVANVHPLITVFGVIVGVNLFGFIGIIFGPILFSLLFWLFKIYKAEFTSTRNNI